LIARALATCTASGSFKRNEARRRAAFSAMSAKIFRIYRFHSSRSFINVSLLFDPTDRGLIPPIRAAIFICGSRDMP
jgi:hypothetical protein